MTLVKPSQKGCLQYIFIAYWCFGTYKHFPGTINSDISENINIKQARPLSSNNSSLPFQLPHPFYPFLCVSSSSSSFSSSSILFFIQIWTIISSPALYTCMMMKRKSLMMEMGGKSLTTNIRNGTPSSRNPILSCSHTSPKYHHSIPAQKYAHQPSQATGQLPNIICKDFYSLNFKYMFDV